MTVSQEVEENTPQGDGKFPLPSVGELKERLETLNGDITSFIKKNPGVSLLGAVALGYVIARIARKAG